MTLLSSGGVVITDVVLLINNMYVYLHLVHVATTKKTSPHMGHRDFSNNADS